MNKKEFTKTLTKLLKDLPRAERRDRLAFYEEMLADRMEEGMTEAEAAESIILSAREEFPAEETPDKRKLGALQIALLVLGSPIWIALGIAFFAVLISLFAALWAVVISIFAVGIALMIGGLGGMVLGAMHIFRGRAGTGLAFIGAGLLCTGLGILVTIAAVAACRGAAKLTKSTALWIASLFFTGKHGNNTGSEHAR